MREMMKNNSDFPSKTHHLSRWFGFERFVVMSSFHSEGTNVGESQMLLSSLTIAAGNCGMQLPMFVVVGRQELGVYIGSMFSNSYIQTNFYSDVLENFTRSKGKFSLDSFFFSHFFKISFFTKKNQPSKNYFLCFIQNW